MLDQFMASDLGEEMDTETEISGDIRNLLAREGSVNAYGFQLGEMKANRTKMMVRDVVKLVEFKCCVLRIFFKLSSKMFFCTLQFKHGPLTNCLYLYAVLFMQNYLQSEENGTKRRVARAGMLT